MIIFHRNCALVSPSRAYPALAGGTGVAWKINRIGKAKKVKEVLQEIIHIGSINL
jgi:hypothetical protein